MANQQAGGPRYLIGPDHIAWLEEAIGVEEVDGPTAALGRELLAALRAGQLADTRGVISRWRNEVIQRQHFEARAARLEYALREACDAIDAGLWVSGTLRPRPFRRATIDATDIARWRAALAVSKVEQPSPAPAAERCSNGENARRWRCDLPAGHGGDHYARRGGASSTWGWARCDPSAEKAAAPPPDAGLRQESVSAAKWPGNDCHPAGAGPGAPPPVDATCKRCGGTALIPRLQTRYETCPDCAPPPERQRLEQLRAEALEESRSRPSERDRLAEVFAVAWRSAGHEYQDATYASGDIVVLAYKDADALLEARLAALERRS